MCLNLNETLIYERLRKNTNSNLNCLFKIFRPGSRELYEPVMSYKSIINHKQELSGRMQNLNATFDEQEKSNRHFETPRNKVRINAELIK